MQIQKIKPIWIGCKVLASLAADGHGIALAQSNYLLARGITTGCGRATFCPDDKAENFEMAVFATRARQFPDGRPRDADNFFLSLSALLQ
jgi:hypothetical protein